MMQYQGRESTYNRSVNSGLLQRRCACGKLIAAGGECAECRKKRLAAQRQAVMTGGRASISPTADNMPGYTRPGGARKVSTFAAGGMGSDLSRVAVTNCKAASFSPTKAVDERAEEANQLKPPPTQGSATIQCNGSGGYEVVLNSWSTATCGTRSCVVAHETSHMADWQAKWPNGCQGQPKGYLPKGDPPDSPLMTAAEYNAFLKESECKAHTVDLNCAKALPQTGGCKKTVQDYIELTENQCKNWCPSLSRGAKIGIGIGGGAAVGAGIGALAGGPVGAAIGVGVGAVVGGIAGALL